MLIMSKKITQPEISFEEHLMNLYPNLFNKDCENKPICTDCGIYVPDGWKFLVENLCASINNYTTFGESHTQKNKMLFTIKLFIYNKFIRPLGEVFYRLLDPYKKYKTKSDKTDEYWLIKPEILELIKEKHPWRLSIFTNTQYFFSWFRPHYKWHIEKVPKVVINQIKEKFGELRFYYSGGDQVVAGMVRLVENLSSKTCEISGEPGKLYKKAEGYSWYKTLSPKMAKKMKYILVKSEYLSDSKL